jgi:hypothetical protein
MAGKAGIAWAMKGFMDLTRRSTARRPRRSKHISSLAPEQVKRLHREPAVRVAYMHGTHVAGIAVEASLREIVINRYTFDYHIPRAILTSRSPSGTRGHSRSRSTTSGRPAFAPST